MPTADTPPIAVAPPADIPASVPRLPTSMGALRFEFYRDGYRMLWTVLLVVVAMLFISLALNLIQYQTRKPVQTVGLTPDLRAIELRPLSEAHIGPNEIINWAARTVPESFDLNYREYRKQVSGREPNFTEAGFRSYLKALEFIRMEELIKQNSYIVTGAVSAAPRVVGTGKLNGTHFWKLEVPVVVTFASGPSETTQNLLITVIALRVDTERNLSGVAIHSFVPKRQ